MGKIADRIKDISPLTDPPVYNFLMKQAEVITKLLAEGEAIASEAGGKGLLASLQRRALTEWDRAVWRACRKFGVDEVRVAGRCLRKRGLLAFLPKEERQVHGLRSIQGGRK